MLNENPSKRILERKSDDMENELKCQVRQKRALAEDNKK